MEKLRLNEYLRYGLSGAVYRIMLKKIHGYEWKCSCLLPWTFLKEEIELDVKRSNKRCENKNPYKNGFDEWFSRIHFLYCSTWAIFITLIIGYFIKPCGTLSKKALLFFLIFGLFTFFLALFDDVHAMKVEKEILNNQNNRPKN